MNFIHRNEIATGDGRTVQALAGLSFQNGPYPENTECIHCHKDAAHLIGVIDDDGPIGSNNFLCNRPKLAGMKYWPHDACSIAIYLCGDCLEVTAKFTQA